MSFVLCAFIVISVFATSFLSGVFGMAGGMILMGLLVWQLPVQQAMILHAAAQFTANASRAFIHRKHIHTKSLWPYFAGLGLVFCLFAMISFVTDKMLIYLLLGVSPFLALALPKQLKLDFTKPLHAFICGGMVTFFQLTSGVGGPLLDVFFQNRAMTRHQTVATKAFTQAAAHVTKFIYFGVVVSTFTETFAGLSPWLFAVIIPVAMAGTHAGKYLLEKLDDKQFYRITQTLLLTLGAIYIVKAAEVWINAG